MLKKILNNRLFILYLIPLIIGSLATLSFSPFNFKLINFIILPLLFYFVVYINKKSRGIYRKKPYKKIYLYLDYYLVMVFFYLVYLGSQIH